MNNNRMTFFSRVDGKEKGPFKTFQLAFASFLPGLQELSTKVTRVASEMSCSIRACFVVGDEKMDISIETDEVMEFAHVAWLVNGDGQLTNQGQPLSESQVKAIFLNSRARAKKVEFVVQ